MGVGVIYELTTMITIAIPNAIIRIKDEATGIRTIRRIPTEPESLELPPD